MAKKPIEERSFAAQMLGRQRWKGRSKAERTAHGRLMAQARWTRAKAAKKLSA